MTCSRLAYVFLFGQAQGWIFIRSELIKWPCTPRPTRRKWEECVFMTLLCYTSKSICLKRKKDTSWKPFSDIWGFHFLISAVALLRCCTLSRSNGNTATDRQQITVSSAFLFFYTQMLHIKGLKWDSQLMARSYQNDTHGVKVPHFKTVVFCVGFLFFVFTSIKKKSKMSN